MRGPRHLKQAPPRLEDSRDPCVRTRTCVPTRPMHADAAHAYRRGARQHNLLSRLSARKLQSTGFLPGCAHLMPRHAGCSAFGHVPHSCAPPSPLSCAPSPSRPSRAATAPLFPHLLLPPPHLARPPPAPPRLLSFAPPLFLSRRLTVPPSLTRPPHHRAPPPCSCLPPLLSEPSSLSRS